MSRTLRLAICRCLVASTVACAGGENGRGNDTRPPEPSPAARPRTAAAPAWTWDARAGTVFAIPGGSAGTARLIRPEWTDEQALDSLTAPDGWVPNGTKLELSAGGAVTGGASLSDLRVDSACAGWPIARLDPLPSIPWRVAFQPELVTGVPFDSLSMLARPDSARVTTEAARAASLFVDDTTASFRGRPFIVRQASRFDAGDGTSVMFVEIVRLVPQEANPQQEQLVMILERAPGDATPGVALAQRSAGLEEAIASVELLAVVRVRASGRLVALLRRDRETGFFLQWLERVSPGRWRVTWQSALDSC